MSVVPVKVIGTTAICTYTQLVSTNMMAASQKGLKRKDILAVSTTSTTSKVLEHTGTASIVLGHTSTSSTTTVAHMAVNMSRRSTHITTTNPMWTHMVDT